MKHFAVLSLAAASLALTAIPAHATDINFDGLLVAGQFQTYSEGGFTVSKDGGAYIESLLGDPGPALYEAIGTDSLLVTYGGTDFEFDSISLLDGSVLRTPSYTITGLLNGATVFTENGTFNNLLGFQNFSFDTGSTLINSLEITVSGGAATVDNIQVTPTPEPSSLMLLGTGLVGVAGAARRRFLKQ